MSEEQPARGAGSLGPRLPVWWIAAAAGLVPLFAVHICLAISILTGAIESGLPYLDGSTSVSRACRHEPAIHVFRALMLPSATLVALTWWSCSGWIQNTGLGGKRARNWVLGLGLAAALFFVLYAAFLGTHGDVYRLLRRYGVYVFFGGTSVAELMVTILLSRARPPSLEPWVRRGMWAVCWLMIAAGPVNIVAHRIVEHDVVGNALEWWFTLGMSGYLLLLARVWAREGLRLELGRDVLR